MNSGKCSCRRRERGREGEREGGSVSRQVDKEEGMIVRDGKVKYAEVQQKEAMKRTGKRKGR